MSTPARVLIIAGSDSGGGAGIQADLKTVTCLGGYAMTAITAITAQNTMGVFGVHPVPEAFIAQQIDLCLSDIGADAIKTGMLHSAGVIDTVIASLDRFLSSPLRGEDQGGGDLTANARGGITPTLPSPLKGEGYRIPLVVDPVMVAKGGSPLLEEAALDALRTRLIPRATLITPNLPEAELLLGRAIAETDDDMIASVNELMLLGCKSVLLKGGHASGETLTDVLGMGTQPAILLKTKRIDTQHTHGTGCTFASAIATGLAQKLDLASAVRRAHTYVQDAIAAAPGLGHGHGPLGHGVAIPRRGH